MTPNEDPIKIVHPENEADIEELNRNYHRVLKAAAIRILLKAMPYAAAEVEADGVLQQVYLELLMKDIKGVRQNLLGYVFGMARNKAYDRVRDRIRKQRLNVQLDPTLEGRRLDVEKEFENKERIERARSRMSVKEQELIDRVVEGQSGKKMADDSGEPESTVRSRLKRLRTKVKKMEED